MAPIGIQNFFYSRTLPARSIPIAQISAVQTTPADLVDVLNTPLFEGTLGVWAGSGTQSSTPTFTVPDYNQSVEILGNVLYYVNNQFLHLTNQFASDGTPLYYCHSFLFPVSGVIVLDSTGKVVTASTLFINNQFFHDLPMTDSQGGAYQIRYVTPSGTVTVGLLHYDYAMQENPQFAGPTTYTLVGRSLQVFNTGVYSIRFTKTCGYQVLPPYTTPSYLPWYPRVRFPISTPEYTDQIWLPSRPYMMGSWVCGTVLNSHLVQFDCPDAYTDVQKPCPDIIVFDSNFAIKYAMDGTAENTASGDASLLYRGNSYPWKRQQVTDFDATTARAVVLPELDETDNVYAFYAHKEPDVLYTALDVNPMTNPGMTNCSVQFYYRSDNEPFQRIFHQVFDGEGNAVAGQTNDPDPPNWITQSPQVFGQLVVGATFGTASFTVKDVRVRGGGLAPEFQGLPVANNFWDLGYLDGRPYPVGAALVVYLPTSILNSMTKELVASKVNSVIPMGMLAVIRYYDQNGNESV